MKLYIAGDSHGRLDRLEQHIAAVVEKYKVDGCLHVGDFGFYPQVFKAYASIRFPVPVWAIRGNHENHDYLVGKARKKSHLKWAQTHNLHYVEDGQVLQFGSASIGFMGGAFNVDRPQHGSEEDETTNYPAPKTVQRTIRAFNENPPECVVTHACPYGLGIGVRGSEYFIPTIALFIQQAGFDVGQNIFDCGEKPLNQLWEGLHQKPQTWFFGHYHQYVHSCVDKTRFYCVGCDDGPLKPYCHIYDTETRTCEILSLLDDLDA